MSTLLKNISFKIVSKFIEGYFSYSLSKQIFMSFRGQASCTKNDITQGVSRGTGMPPDQKSKQSRLTLTYLSIVL
jgi:hypothetical protein